MSLDNMLGATNGTPNFHIGYTILHALVHKISNTESLVLLVLKFMGTLALDFGGGLHYGASFR